MNENKKLFETIVGSHVWDMETPTSDLDVFEAYIAPTRDFLIGKTHSGSHHSTTKFVDRTSTEIGTVISQLLKNNVNYLTYVYTPEIICGEHLLSQLKEITTPNLSKLAYNSIHRLGLRNYRKYIESEKIFTYKKLNTIARVLQFGITLLSTGKIEFLPTNIRRKEEILELLANLDIGLENSILPETPERPDLLEDWLYNLRISNIIK